MQKVLPQVLLVKTRNNGEQGGTPTKSKNSGEAGSAGSLFLAGIFDAVVGVFNQQH